MKLKRIMTIIVLLLLAVSVWYLLADKEEADDGALNALMSLEVVNGEMYSAADLSSMPTLVVIWTTWCPSCLEELAYLKEHYQEISSLVNLVAVNATIHERSINDVDRLLEVAELPFVVLVDQDGQSMKHFQSRYIPANFLVDINGKVINSLEGPISKETIIKWLE